MMKIVIRIRPLDALFVLILLHGCANKPTDYFGSTVPRHGPDELWINLSNEPEYLDPGKAADSVASELTWNLFAGLLQAHPVTLRPTPEIATHWDVSKDGKIYTFHLRKSQWSDGIPLTARDFEWSWKRVLDPKTDSQYASLFFQIKNAEAFNLQALWIKGTNHSTFPKELPIERTEISDELGATVIFIKGAGKEGAENRKKLMKALSAKVVSSDQVGIKALDDYTLEVRLENSIPYFLDLASYYTLLPVPRHVIERLEREGKNPDLWTQPENLVSNGAYIMKRWKFRQYMDFEKNPRYWDAEHVRTPKIHGPMVESYNTTLNMYATGELDWIGRNASLPNEFMDRLSLYKDFSRHPYLSVYFYWVNTTAPPLNNPKLRKALNLAIDRQSLVKYVTRSGQIPTADLVPDGLAGYKGLNTPIYDPEQARRLLKEAGFKSGASVPPVTVIYNTSEGHKMIAEAVQQMWKKELGIDARIENQEWKVFLRNQRMMNFQLARMGWVGDYPDPYTYLDLLLPNNENNHSNWKSKEYESLLRKANQILDPEGRLAALRKAEEMLREEVPCIPMYVYTRSQLVKPYLKGFWPNFQDRNPWKYFWVDKRWYDGVPTTPAEDPPPE
jgi:oligopeptide transport system substrate-binding protein